MKPEKYLNKRGREIFKRIHSHLVAKGLDEDVFSIMLSQLCHSIWMAEDAIHKLMDGKMTTTAKTGWEQVSPYVTIHKEALSQITKLLPKFGITPQDLERLKTKEEKKSKLNF